MSSIENSLCSQPPRIAYLVGWLDRLLRRRIADAVAPFGLTTPQFTALGALHANKRLSNARLAELSFVTPQATGEMVKTLEKKGLIYREQNPAHGRIIWIRLTKAGEELIRQCDAAVDRLEQKMLEEIPLDERPQLARALMACSRSLAAGPTPLVD